MNPRTLRAPALGLLLLLFPLGLLLAVWMPSSPVLLRAMAMTAGILAVVLGLAWRKSVSRCSEREAELDGMRDQLRAARDQAQQNALLVQLAEELRSLDGENVWETVCAFLARALDASRVAAYEKAQRGAYRLRTQYLAEGISPLDEATGLPATMVEDRELALRIASADLMVEEDPELRTLVGKVPPRSLFVVPVERERAERAALAIHHCDGARALSEHERRFVYRVAQHLGNSLDRAERSRELERAAEARSGLLRFAQALAATRETRAVVEIAVSAGAPLARSPRSALLLEEEGASFRLAADSGLAAAFGPLSISILRPRIDEALRERAPILVEGSEITGGRYPARSTPGSFALVPMFYAREPMGVLLLESPPSTERLDLEVARTVAELVSTALKTARRFESLEASEAGYAVLCEEGNDIILVVDDSGVVCASNPATRRTLGYSETELAGVQLSSVLAADSLSVWRELDKTLFSEGRIHDAELKLRGKEGTVVEVLASAVVSPAGPTDSRPRSARILMRDVTELRSTEHQLRHSQKLEVVGALAGGIAHDFNNVLGGILGYASLIRTYLKDRPIAAKYLETIERSAIRGAELTGRLLSASRKTPARWEPVNLNLVVEETLELLAHSLHKSIRLDRRLDSRVRSMMADASQLQQIVLNLCVNARDAMPNGGLLRISTRLNDAGDRIQLTVEDTGVGMDAKTLARLFEPFFSTKGDAGTGLGLSVVYGIVRSLGGEVGVKSSPGRGARFDVVLPCHLAEEAPSLEQAADEAPLGHGELILLVDDEKVLRDLGKDILEAHGYRVTTVSNGEEAIEFLRGSKEPVALVILDVVMPGLGGSGTYQRLRSIGSPVPVLLSSGLAAEEIVQDLLDGGASGFIPKPYGIGDLTRAVSSALRRRNPTLVH
jgi:PAS domain S-box-containing protein